MFRTNTEKIFLPPWASSLKRAIKAKRLLGSWSKTPAGSWKPRVYGRWRGALGNLLHTPVSPGMAGVPSLGQHKRLGEQCNPWNGLWLKHLCCISVVEPWRQSTLHPRGLRHRPGSAVPAGARAVPAEAWASVRTGNEESKLNTGLLSVSVQNSSCTKINVQNQTTSRTSSQIFLQDTVLALWAVGWARGWLSPTLSPSAAVPAAVTDSLTEHPRTERGCTTHMAENRKNTQGKLAKISIFQKTWGIQRTCNSLVQEKKNCSWVRQNMQVFSLFQFYSTA